VESAISITLNGLVLSSMYVLVALGLALLISIIGIFNFAHGAIYMVGGYVCYEFSATLGVNEWLSLLIAIVIVGSFGLFLEKYCFRRFPRNINAAVVLTMAISMILETSANIAVGGESRSIGAFVSGIITVGGVSFSAEKFVTLIIGAILLFALTMFIKKAKAGQQMQAISQDMEGAALQGISINRISALACVLGCALAAVAGSLLGAIFSVSPFMGDTVMFKAIQMILISGIGSIGGLLAAGIIVGFVDAAIPVFANAAIAKTIGFAIVIIILLVRPKGLFGYEML
jgi:branched-chain amino acid transport system permease protein